MAQTSPSPTSDATYQDAEVDYTVVYDTYCGWSYGAAEVLQSVVTSGARVQVLHRHLFQGDNAPRLAEGYAEHMTVADGSIAELTGAEYTEAYATNVRGSTTEILESGLTADAAALVRDQGPQAEFELSRQLQRRRFVDGISAQNRSDLVDELVAFGLTREQAERVGTPELRDEAQATSQRAAALMARAGASGVPALIAHRPTGDQLVDISQFYDDPEAGATAARKEARND